MSDPTRDDEPGAGHDPTNGLAGDLEGDDGGAVEQHDHTTLAGAIVEGLDPDRPVDEGDDSTTSYSEEGKP
ncbi:hypothetical protein [Leifsonia sp. NPDC080035]|uniref:Uncharacterized protein n=1 Tax=Leifsonia sp. NPDC080035 TaxID=3143936 RepID=A0AAU7GHG5_9MICO